MPKGKQHLRTGKPGIRYNAHYGMSDYYQFYLKQVDTLKSNQGIVKKNYIVDKGTFNDIISEFNELFVQKVLNDGLMIPLPHNFGYIGVKKQKVPFHAKNRLKVDWEKKKETGMNVFFTNDHTNNYFYKIMWIRPKANFPSKNLYHYIPVRYFKRTLGKLLKNKLADYPENLKTKYSPEQQFAINQLYKNKRNEIKRIVQEYKDKYNI